MLKNLILFYFIKYADFGDAQAHGGISRATYESRAVGNLKVSCSVQTAPLQEGEYLHEHKLTTKTVCADFALKLHFLVSLVFLTSVLKPK